MYRQNILLKSKGNNHSNLLPPSDIGYEKYWIRKSLNFIPPKKSKTNNKNKIVITPVNAYIKFDMFLDFRKNIIDKIVIKKITYTVGACLEKNENPSKTGIKNQNILFLLLIAKINEYSANTHNINV